MAKAKAKAPDLPTGPAAEAGGGLVPMVRDPAAYPAPWSVEVHPDMIDDYRRAGFTESKGAGHAVDSGGAPAA